MFTNWESWLTTGGTLLVVIINAIISYINNQHLAVIKVQTNHMKDALVGATGAANFQAGVTAAIADPQQASLAAVTKTAIAAALQSPTLTPSEKPK